VRLPFVSRAHHEEVVALLRSQLAGLARTLYEGDVPEEFQMLLGISIPSTGKKAVAKLQAEPDLTPDQKIEEEAAERKAAIQRDLESRRRTRPSTLGPQLERVMKQTTYYAARAANPAVAQMFDSAKKDVLKDR
jgi:hypothetical protein